MLVKDFLTATKDMELDLKIYWQKNSQSYLPITTIKATPKKIILITQVTSKRSSLNLLDLRNKLVQLPQLATLVIDDAGSLHPFFGYQRKETKILLH